MSYLETTREVYRQAALSPQPGLCCTSSPPWRLPGFEPAAAMLEMNYGCGTTVYPRDLAGSPTVVYVGVGGGLELLQFSYFCRRAGAVLGVDPVDEMRAAAARNLVAAAALNPWFRTEFVELRAGDALATGLPDASAGVVAQNCLFNIFKEKELERALAEAHRVLKPGGRLVLSDPIAPAPLPPHLADDERLRALCLSGAITWERYRDLLIAAGFGTIEVRARRPYRALDPAGFGVERPILLEAVEVAAVKDPVPPDGACVFTGRTAIYVGARDSFDDGAGHVLTRNVPVDVCDKTAEAMLRRGGADIMLTRSTWFYGGGGCC